MRLVPRSLFGRLLGIAAVTTIVALAFAALSISHVLERFVIRGLDQQLDAQIGILAKAVRADGTLDAARIVNLPAFETAGSGWSWQVDGANGEHWSQGAVIVPRATPDRPMGPRGHEGLEGAPEAGDGNDLSGEPIHFRQLMVPSSRGAVRVMAAGPRRVALRPLREAMAPLLGSLALLGAGLAFATVLQLRIGLHPLRRLSGALAEVRAGRARHVPLDQPAELLPLVTELNALIDQNEAGLNYARRHVSNLAHGLKTPLAALAVKLAESGRDPDGSLTTMVQQIDARVRRHLGRARAAAPGGGQRSRILLAPAIADLTHALARIHAERTIRVSIEVEPDLAVAVDRQDLDEMVGNLLDNAWRHARATIVVGAVPLDATIALTIDDDGPGLDAAAIRAAFVPGRRLDEQGDGYGFGLSITEELAGLCGGTLALSASPALPGLRAILTLPAAR